MGSIRHPDSNSCVARYVSTAMLAAMLAIMSGCGSESPSTDISDDAVLDVVSDVIGDTSAEVLADAPAVTDITTETDTDETGGDHVIHVDLTGLAPQETAYLHIGDKIYTLKRHDEETRDEARDDNVLLQVVADEDLTHYAEDVELPDDRVALMWVTNTPDDNRVGEHGFGLVGIHIPERSITKARTIRAHQGWTKYKKYLVNPLPKRDSNGSELLRLGTDANDDPDEFVTPLDAAKAILFHHPELTSLDPDVAALVMTHIENSVGLIELAESISAQGPAYEHDDKYSDGWAILEPILDDNGNRRLKKDGTPFYNYNLSDKTAADAELVLRNVLRSAHNDPALKGSTYHTQDGVGSIDVTPETPAALRAGESAYYNWTLDHTQSRSGLEARISPLDNNPTTGNRRVKISLKNHWLRHLTFFVGFEDSFGHRVEIPAGQTTSHDDTANKLQYVSHLAPVVTIMGIPLPADWEDYTIEIPNDASRVNLYAGGLGVGYLDFPKVASDGIILTAVFEYALPTIFLAAGAGLQSTEWYKSIMADSDLVFAISAIGFFLLAGENAAEIGLGGNPKRILSRSASMLGGILLSYGCSKLKTYLVAKMAETQFEQAIPFVGWALKLLSISATLSAIAQTTVEVLSSPWVIKNSATATQKMRITIHHDPDDYQFPATATSYKLIIKWGDAADRTIGPIPMPGTTVSEPIVIEIEEALAGGVVEATVGFYSDTGWLAGRGSTGRLSNVLPVGQDTLDAAITIEEMLVPLDETTLYSHKQSLNYISGQYEWVAGEAPDETIADLSCDNVGSHLCQLDNITFSQRTGMFGYAWQAAGPGMTQCNTSTTDLQLHYVQNLSAKQDPGIAYKSLECGMSTQSTIIYDLLGPVDGTGNNFFLDTRDGQYHLRKVVLDETTPMTYLGNSWGRFTQPLDDIAMRDGGYVVGANWANSKLEILKLPDEPFPDETAPWAQLISGQGTREGLLYGPKAIAFTADGTLLILESLNKRIQALDIDGNPVKYFHGKTEYHTLLHAETEQVTYLDMGVEYLGYIYVLSYIRDGASTDNYRLDIYSPAGEFLSRTSGFAAAKMTVDLWRNVYSLNYEKIAGPGGRTEPSVSEWIPSTP
ncbi:MAG TPA: hypothetical protein PLY68_00645 [Myxococcota bacterium]|nr:hypothetical protein [Myxococcota bacterium]HQP94686.1 hypothetical protein [Myxococcota bacterium]